MAVTTPPAMAPMWLLTFLPGSPAPGVTVVGGMPIVMYYNVGYIAISNQIPTSFLTDYYLNGV